MLRHIVDVYGGGASSLDPHEGFFPCPWILQAKQQLHAINALSENWDGNGATAPRSEIVQNAMSLLSLVASKVATLPKPDINPTRNGGVQFEWQAGSAFLLIEVVDPEAICYYFEDDKLGVEEEESISLSNWQRVMQLLQKFRWV